MERESVLVRRVRRLLLHLALISLVLSLPALHGAAPALLVVGTACLASFAASLTWRYRTNRSGVVFTVFDAVAIIGYASCTPTPAATFGFLFPAVWFRALEGTRGGQLAYWASLSTALLVSVPVWHAVHEGVSTDTLGFLMGGLPLSLLTTIAAGRLGQELRAREQAQQRDGVLAELGTRLLGVTDRATVLVLAREATRALCRVTPQLQVLTVLTNGAGKPEVVSRDGLPCSPSALPVALLPAAAGPLSAWHQPGGQELRRVLGPVEGTWMWLPFPEGRGGMVLGGPQTVLADAVVSAQSLLNQVALALRSSEQHTSLVARATTDSLTGLANRAAFEAEVATMLARPARAETAVLFVDLDDFKYVNDSLGHAAGDELLQVIAQRLRATARDEDLCARLGGDEFAVLLPNTPVGAAATFAERVVQVLSDPIRLSGHHARVGASIGVTALDTHSLEEAMSCADIAMYASKSRGKNQVSTYDPATMPSPAPHAMGTGEA
ncbi:hypothetical protein GCM10027586_00380 [Kineococcus gypseus]|uniref:diguanylate cyclase domain-containing protein n=1 Tax=Kineococcus gypseus TaxID=1637102 RepID=UPI003D7D992D